MLDSVIWTLIGFAVGSIPFSILIGRLVAHKDIRTVGDGNPGGTNAFKAGGMKAGLPAAILDISKGFFPVWIAQRSGLTGWELVPVALAPALGHAFSPFLRWHGGKALGATGGAWLALIGLQVFPIYATLALPLTLIQSEDAWSACAGMLALVVYSFLQKDDPLIAFAIMNTLLILWTHRISLTQPPQARRWVKALFPERGT